jgi:hypothetical protein
LNKLLFDAETAINARNQEDAILSITAFAELVFQVDPFSPTNLPKDWKQKLHEWLSGRPLSDIVSEDPEEGVRFVEEAIVYQLVWAMESVRVRSVAHDDLYSELWNGRAALAAETGTLDAAANVLLQAGLGSRVAARRSLIDCPADFNSFVGMIEWLRSEEVVAHSRRNDWPTPDTATAWNNFVRSTYSDDRNTWKIRQFRREVRWNVGSRIPPSGTMVRVASTSTARSVVHTPDYRPMGQLRVPIQASVTGTLFGEVTDPDSLLLTYIGPDKIL